MSIFNNVDKEGNRYCPCDHVDGLENVPIGESYYATINNANRALDFVNIIKKRGKITLNFAQICAVEIVTDKEITEKNKSVVGRAVVGGLLLGPVGAVVGGVSGTGKKQKKKINNYLIVNYHPFSAPESTAVIKMRVTGSVWPTFIRELKQSVGIKPEEVPSRL